MPWEPIKLNSGYDIPSIGFGTWKTGKGQGPVDQIKQAMNNGFNHIDTAQNYGNEIETGIALKESGLPRSDVFVTTKYSRVNNLDVPTSIKNSVNNLGVSYVDLYLIHSPRWVAPDIPTCWAQMEKVQEDGLAKSIGISNFSVQDMELLMASAKVKPAVNQILLHPYVYQRQKPILEYAAKNGIVIEAYSALIPITKLPGGPLDKPLNEIAAKFGATPEQVLMAWTKAKGAVVVTGSSKEMRLRSYLAAGDIALSPEDIAVIDAAGALGRGEMNVKTILRRVVVWLL
ncbi:NADP-dependent oxidoreductase domain-containing protein [Suillus paluster]|uniref:NADP-dependent oxidoreductase domain-containing protein n=1 Tax=Suillus paluster TaxID=48578 RepID=UPI001B85F756|nr:NADP-dependent oxidoreductase domain-containing protein [Suillus paluster]KAG1734891.1 NADP-dependent oxidoreductase domain-containing protein [Suillus paluster]